MLKESLPKFEIPKLNLPKLGKFKRIFGILILIILISSVFGFLAGVISGKYFYSDMKNYLQKLNIELPTVYTQPESEVIEKGTIKEYIPQTSQEEAIVQAVKNISPAVVSIIVSKDLAIIEEYYIEEWPFSIPRYRERIEKREIGGGTGFIISQDGMILTNKHVVVDTEADYTVFTNDGREFPAEILARDPVQDLAIIKVKQNNLPVVKLGDSSSLQIGQTVVAVGNALGEFRNTVSVGVISGLGRTVTASGGGLVSVLEDIIQTDAAINKGNSGGPLSDLKGEVIGINTAVAMGAENIGFAIPINKAERAIEQVKTIGKIVYPFLGIRYVLITDKIQEKNNLSVNYGAWVVGGDEPDELAIFPGSAAQKAGLKENDIVLEFNNEKITTENSLAKVIMKYNPGDKVVLMILRDGEQKIVSVTLGERSE